MSLGNHIKVFMCVVFMGVLVGVVYKVKSDVTDGVHIDAAKDGYVTEFPDVTVSTAFNYYFIEPYWRYYETKTGEHVVELSGEITQFGESGHAILQFIVNEEATEFEVGAMKFNDVVQKKEDKFTLVAHVYEDWYTKKLARQ